jgi:proliferating cell nuclear antigen
MLLKKIVEALRDLVQEVNVDCREEGLSLQAMDASHVSLCALNLRSDGFDHYRCDRTISLGLHLVNLSKFLKCAGNEDIITLKSEDSADSLSLVFESNSKQSHPCSLSAQSHNGFARAQSRTALANLK